MSSQARFEVIVIGKVPKDIYRETVSTFNDFYHRLGSRVPGRVEIRLVDKEITMQHLLKEEKVKLGITTTGDEEFIATHDAWHDFPRVIICIERLARFDKIARQGVIRHEAAHTVLHGGLNYYIFKIPEEAAARASSKGLDPAVLQQVHYYLAAGVKDFEVTGFLINEGFFKSQAAFALKVLVPSEEDKKAWLVARANRQSRILYQAALLKPLLFAHPLLTVTEPMSKLKTEKLQIQVNLGRQIELILEHLGEVETARLLQVTNLIAERLTSDTHHNVAAALSQFLDQI